MHVAFGHVRCKTSPTNFKGGPILTEIEGYLSGMDNGFDPALCSGVIKSCETSCDWKLIG